MNNIHVIQGREIREDNIKQISELIAGNPQWSRRRISVELALLWEWRTCTGQLKDMAARSLLLKLEQRGWIELPKRLRISSKRKRVESKEQEEQPVPCSIDSSLSGLLPITLKQVRNGTGDYEVFSKYLKQYHYLGYRGRVGENLSYLISDKHGRDLGCLLFGSAAWKTQARDEFIGWDSDTRVRRLSYITNNTRFLILPWVKVPHLASHVLGKVLRRLCSDWQLKYGHPVYAVETFVEKNRFIGTSYIASNWRFIGETKGRSRQDRYSKMQVPVKDIYVYPLKKDFREALCEDRY